MTEAVLIALRLTLAAAIAAALVSFDQALFGIDLARWMCALIGIAVVYGGWLVIVIAEGGQ
jgi:hypothetical protein